MKLREILIASCLAVGAEASAQDTVHVRGADGRTVDRVGGEILDWTAESLTLRRPGDRIDQVPADRVERIETARTPNALAGDEAFAARQYEPALTEYRKAILDEKRVWMRRELQAQIVRCHRNLNQWMEALEAFEKLVRSDATVLHFDAAPVMWTSESLPGGAEALARAALEPRTIPPPAPAVRLVAASWLLSTAHRGTALQALQNLISQADARIAFWAEAQLWRVQTVSATADSVARWRERWERMPPEIHAPPAFLLGQVYARLNLHEEAALFLLRSPLLEPHDPHVNGAALLAAGRELETMDRGEQAVRLYQELLAKYGSTAAAASAKQRLEQLAKP